MQDELNEYFQCVGVAGRWKFQVGIVAWDGPSEPRIEWRTWRSWLTPPTEKRLQKARAAAIAEPRFFRTCTRCGELNNAGHMDGQQTCQSCAERYLGVVH
jgi:hypothetical protein